MPEFIDDVRSISQAVVDKKKQDAREEVARRKSAYEDATAAIKLGFTEELIREAIEKEAAEGRFSARIKLYEDVASRWPHWSDDVGKYVKRLCEEMGFSARYDIKGCRPGTGGYTPYYTGIVEVRWDQPEQTSAAIIKAPVRSSVLTRVASWFGIETTSLGIRPR